MGLPWIQRSNKPAILKYTASCCSTAWVHPEGTAAGCGRSGNTDQTVYATGRLP